MTRNRPKTAEPPGYLRESTRAWFTEVAVAYGIIEPHAIRLLIAASEAWDRMTEAREAIKAHGLTFEDKHGQPRCRPEVAVERDSRIAFSRMLRELNLDVADPDQNRPPRPGQTRRGA